MDYDSQIEAAIKAHGQWLFRLRSAIESGESTFKAENVKKDNNCDFGKWIYGDFPEGIKRLPVYEEIRLTHAKFHQIAGNILELALQGKKEQAIKQMGVTGELMTVSAILNLKLQLLLNKK